MVRVILPYPLQVLAGTSAEVLLEPGEPVTLASVISALETRYPALRGAIIERESGRRRALIRFFACSRDLSHEPLESPLPEAVSSGEEALLIIGAIAGG